MKLTTTETFDFIEEFLLFSLYDDWEVFMETESGNFRHNEFRTVERTITIRSKEVDDLLRTNQIKLASLAEKQDATRWTAQSQQQQQQQQQPQQTSRPETKRVTITTGNDDDNNDDRTTSTMGGVPHNKSTRYRTTFDIYEIVGNSRDLDMFKRFMESQCAAEELNCWLDIEAFTYEFRENLNMHSLLLCSRFSDFSFR